MITPGLSLFTAHSITLPIGPYYRGCEPDRRFTCVLLKLLQCFGTFNDTMYQETTLDQDWRLWQFQVCTQWGYFTVSLSCDSDNISTDFLSSDSTTGPESSSHHLKTTWSGIRIENLQTGIEPIPFLLTSHSLFIGVLTRKTIYCASTSQHHCCKCSRRLRHCCRPPRFHWWRRYVVDVTTRSIGPFMLCTVDPWRPDTPHSDDAKGRADTILRPFKLIPRMSSPTSSIMHHAHTNSYS